MPGVIVSSGTTQQSAGISLQLGTVFIVAPAIYGPEAPTLVQSLSQGIEFFGPREGESIKLYDALDRFFALEGARAYVKRIFGEGAPAAAELGLESSGAKKVLTVKAKYKGTYGNGLKLEVKESGSNTQLVVYSPEGEVLEKSGEYPKASELLEWGKAHETYVVISEGSEYTTAKGEKLKKLASTKLASGANPTVSATTTIQSIEGIPKALGPGQLLVLGSAANEESVHVAMAEHGRANKRDALADLKGAEEVGTTTATLKSEKGSIPSGVAERINFFAQASYAPGIAGGTTRTIPASVVAAALLARVSRTGNNNQAPAGVKWPLGPQITGFVNTYSESQMTALEESGINCFTEVGGQLCLYGAASALPAAKSEILSQYPAVREIIALEAEAEEAGQEYLFDQITAQSISEFGGDLSGIIKRHKEAKAIEGGEVKTGPPINTPETAKAKQLNAEMVVVIAGTAVTINVRVTSKSNIESI